MTDRNSSGREPWVATFTLLDASGAISASQRARLRAFILTPFRRAVALLSGKMRQVP